MRGIDGDLGEIKPAAIEGILVESLQEAIQPAGTLSLLEASTAGPVRRIASVRSCHNAEARLAYLVTY